MTAQKDPHIKHIQGDEGAKQNLWLESEDLSDNNGISSEGYESSSDSECWEWIFKEKKDSATEFLRKESFPKVLTNETPEGENDVNNSRIRKTKPSVERLVARNPMIVGARYESFEFKIGDAVSVNCDDSIPWVALVESFDDTPSDSGKIKGKVNILWLSNHTDVSNKRKKRMDFLPNELYLTPLRDSIDIRTVNGTVQLMSLNKFNQRYPNGLSKKSQSGSVFICRRGCEARAAIYTDEFIWEDIKPTTEEGVSEIHERIKAQTKSFKRITSHSRNINIKEDSKVENELLETPRKKQKFLAVTPRKLKTPLKLVTPSHKRVMVKKPLEFTPLGTRVLDFDHIAVSPFQKARYRLHVSSVPASLPCREDEFTSVYTHLEAAIAEGSGACIYISGTPGTGKTATVREVVAQLQAMVLADQLDPFIFVEINGMKITDPVQSYSLLWEALKGDRVSPIHALDLLEREFTYPSPRRTPCVVIMDELDQLATKNQLVMYNFFNWPTLPRSRLIVLAVANTMDLPERTLSNKISSRLGLTRITFPGYTFDQLVKIITSRLEGVGGNIVEKDAIEFASRKVAAVSGDARRVLDICRRAVELAEEDSPIDANPMTPSKTQGRSKGIGKVRIETIRRAIKEATSSPLQKYLKELPLVAKLFLVALVVRMRRTGIGDNVLGDVLDEAKKIVLQNTGNNQKLSDFLLIHDTAYTIGCISQQKKMLNKSGKTPPRVLAMGLATVALLEAGIIALETRGSDRTGKVRMCVDEEDIRIAFRDDPEVKTLGF